MRKVLLMAFTAMLLVGCKAGSMNVQRSGLRGAGDTGVTIWLDDIDVDKVPQRQQEIIGTCSSLIDFLAEGELSDVTNTVLMDKLVARVPDEYKWIPSEVFSLAGVMEVDTSAIGERNIRRLVSALNGMINGAKQYKISDRPE